MVADSITDSEIFHRSPISRDCAKKRKANWFGKLKQWKIDARRRQWIYQWKRSNSGNEENNRRLKSFLDKLTDRKAWRIDHEGGSYEFTKCDDDYEIDLERPSSASSPTSVLKNKDSISDDCFLCSQQITEEEEEVFDDAYDNWDCFTDALNSFETADSEQEEDPSPSISQRKEKPSPKKLFHKDKQCKPDTSPEKTIHKNSKKKKKPGKQESDDEKHECPICSEEMDATDLSFKPCPCGFRLCLFCHKKINENDARCPACRNKYDQTSSNNGDVSFQQRGGGTLRLSPSFKGVDRA